LVSPLPPRLTLFPYTTLFRSLIFGEHHMTVAVYARSQAALDDIAAEIRNISATSGINLISEAFGARAHFMAQHPGNTGARSRKRSEEHTSELQSRENLVCRLL